MLHCDTLIVTCIDFRFQQFFDQWIADHERYGDYDRIALAGGVKNWEVVFPQIIMAKTLHHVQRVVLINHEDCGAYGEASSYDNHARDLCNARDAILETYPELKISLYYARLDGVFQPVECTETQSPGS